MNVLIIGKDLGKKLQGVLSDIKYEVIVRSWNDDAVSSVLNIFRNVFAVIIDYDISVNESFKIDFHIEKAMAEELPIILVTQKEENEIKDELNERDFIDKENSLSKYNIFYLRKPVKKEALSDGLLSFYP